MANFQRFNLRLSAILILFFLPMIFPDGFSKGSAWARDIKPRHSLSWESLRSREELKHWRELRRSERRVSVSKRKTVRLKKSSFFNFRPFQFSTPVFADSMIFIGVDRGVFYGIDADRLRKNWSYETEGPVQAAGSVDGNVVYFGDAKGYAYALSTLSGDEIWKISLDAPILATPLIINDRVLFITDSGRLFALRKGSGEEIWHTDPMEKSLGFSIRRASSPVWANGLIFFGTASGTLLAYHENGSIAWIRQLADRQAMVSDIDSKPLIDNDHMYIASADQKIFCLKLSNGDVIWSTDEVGGANDLLLDNGKLYVAGEGVLKALDPSNGDIIWEEDFETPEISSPAINKGIIAVVSTKDKMFLVDDNTGDIMFERYVRRGSFGDPIFVNDSLYLISNTGRLFSFLVREKPAKKAKTQ